VTCASAIFWTTGRLAGRRFISRISGPSTGVPAVKGIAMMTRERSKVLPNVPTGIEQGVPNLEAYTWNAIFLPKGAPAEMVDKRRSTGSTGPLYFQRGG
jgi:tripartite-type tricarboxylate transporter receptor subunit TctC